VDFSNHLIILFLLSVATQVSVSSSVIKNTSTGSRAHNLTYGEITTSSLFQDIFPTLHVQANDVVYDLGSGTGKIPFTFAMKYPSIVSKGIEFAKDRHDKGINAYRNLRKVSVKELRQLLVENNLDHQFSCDNIHASIENALNRTTLIHGDFCSYDLSDATIIFINNTVFEPNLMIALMNKLAQLPKLRQLVVTRQICNRHNKRCEIKQEPCCKFQFPPRIGTCNPTWCDQTSIYTYNTLSYTPAKSEDEKANQHLSTPHRFQTPSRSIRSSSPSTAAVSSPLNVAAGSPPRRSKSLHPPITPKRLFSQSTSKPLISTFPTMEMQLPTSAISLDRSSTSLSKLSEDASQDVSMDKSSPNSDSNSSIVGSKLLNGLTTLWTLQSPSIHVNSLESMSPKSSSPTSLSGFQVRPSVVPRNVIPSIDSNSSLTTPVQLSNKLSRTSLLLLQAPPRKYARDWENSETSMVVTSKTTKKRGQSVNDNISSRMKMETSSEIPHAVRSPSSLKSSRDEEQPIDRKMSLRNVKRRLNFDLVSTTESFDEEEKAIQLVQSPKKPQDQHQSMDVYSTPIRKSTRVQRNNFVAYPSSIYITPTGVATTTDEPSINGDANTIPSLFAITGKSSRDEFTSEGVELDGTPTLPYR
jgi:precorrin-6B methylase 2